MTKWAAALMYRTGIFLVLTVHVYCNEACPSKCFHTCGHNTQGQVIQAQCVDVYIPSLPNSLISLTLSDAIHPSTLIGNVLQSYTLSGKTNLTLLKIEKYGITSLMGQTFRACPELESLDLSRNNIAEIDRENFAGLSKLNYLNLNHNNIKSIHNFTFQALDRLEKLNIAFNNLTELSEKSLSGLGNLIKLDVQANSIQQVHQNAFHMLIKLEELNLQNNSITTLPQDMLSGMPNLRIIYLQRNKIQSIEPQTIASTNIIMLDLSQNAIEKVPSQLLQNTSNDHLTVHLAGNNLTTLEANVFNGVIIDVLFLSSNKISTIDPDALNNSYIRKLDLQQNYLKGIPEGLARYVNLSNILELSNNPWTCDCDFQWVKVLLRPGVQEPTCSEPVSYERNELSDVLNDLKLLCNVGQAALPAPSKTIAVPPRQNPVTPHLNSVTTPPQSTSTNASDKSSTSQQTVGKSQQNEAKGSNLNTPMIIGIVAGVVVLGFTALIIWWKQTIPKHRTIAPDPVMQVSRIDTNRKLYFYYKPADTYFYEV